MNILLLGSGGRECALAWKLAQSPKLKKLWIAPGNAGTGMYGTNISIAETDFNGLKHHVLANAIDMIVVGPEVPLAEGISDYFRNDASLKHVGIIGPSAAGARLESSKDFAKAFMLRHGIPTARYQTFTGSQIAEGIQFLETLNPPFVLKADGLAQGKGVIICQSLDEAKHTLDEMLTCEKFGKASEKVVIEEFLYGIELSVFVLTDGNNYLLLPNAKDYKRIGEGDTGLNTGGMGAVSPVPFADAPFMKKVEDRIIKPTIAGLQMDQTDYCGFIFFGLINCSGNPYVIEYNVRLGDPETEAILPRIENDLCELFDLTLRGALGDCSIKISEQAAVTVILASGGYPGDYQKGLEISGLDNDSACLVFHAGTRANDDGKSLTNGGRVLAVTALAHSPALAKEKAYKAIPAIHFEGMYYRRDIGSDLIS